MNSFRMRFIVGIHEQELLILKKGEKIISKMLLTPDDFRVFHYIEGDEIEAETPKGERIWTTIQHMEIIHDHIRPIIIFTLVHSNTRQSATGTL